MTASSLAWDIPRVSVGTVPQDRHDDHAGDHIDPRALFDTIAFALEIYGTHSHTERPRGFAANPYAIPPSDVTCAGFRLSNASHVAPFQTARILILTFCQTLTV